MPYTISELLALNDETLRDTINSISSSITGSPATYGLTAPIATTLAAKASNFNSTMDALDSTELSYRSAVQDKNLAREDLINFFGLYLQMPYANPIVTNGALASIYLAPRTTRRPFVPPVTPTNFTATAQPNGYVKFKWNRNGNSSNTAYILEELVGNGDWVVISVGSRSRLELSGYAPGTTVSFRVIATKGDDQAQPTDIATIYPEGGFGDISIAA